VSVVAMATSIALLAWFAIHHGGGERVGAIGGMVGVGLGMCAATTAVRRQHADGPMPSLVTTINEIASGAAVVFIGMAVYFAAAFIAGGTAIPIIGGGALLVSLAWASRVVLRREGIEREVLLRATCFAFFVTVLGSAFYAMFESFADAPHLSMWVPYAVGMVTWSIAATVLQHRTA
jgi:hypothetical protein